jgi:hypothetical protein
MLSHMLYLFVSLLAISIFAFCFFLFIILYRCISLSLPIMC